jgi:hypothetical protein
MSRRWDDFMELLAVLYLLAAGLVEAAVWAVRRRP